MFIYTDPVPTLALVYLKQRIRTQHLKARSESSTERRMNPITVVELLFREKRLKGTNWPIKSPPAAINRADRFPCVIVQGKLDMYLFISLLRVDKNKTRRGGDSDRRTIIPSAALATGWSDKMEPAGPSRADVGTGRCRHPATTCFNRNKKKNSPFPVWRLHSLWPNESADGSSHHAPSTCRCCCVSCGLFRIEATKEPAT